MGDYTKLIVNCGIKKTDDVDGLKQEIVERIGHPCSSAYHCGGELIEIQNDWHHRTDITIVTQRKSGRDIDEFLEWLKPQIVDGFGNNDSYAIVATEYGPPRILSLTNLQEEGV